MSPEMEHSFSLPFTTTTSFLRLFLAFLLRLGTWLGGRRGSCFLADILSRPPVAIMVNWWNGRPARRLQLKLVWGERQLPTSCLVTSSQGDRGSSGDTKNHGETFQPEPTAERRDSAPEPRARERLDSPAGTNLRQGLAVPSGLVAGAISKSSQEVSGPLLPACCLEPFFPRAHLLVCHGPLLPRSLPTLRPRAPRPCASFVWLRRAGLRRVELSPRRLLRAAGLAAVAKRPEP